MQQRSTHTTPAASPAHSSRFGDGSLLNDRTLRPSPRSSGMQSPVDNGIGSGSSSAGGMIDGRRAPPSTPFDLTAADVPFRFGSFMDGATPAREAAAGQFTQPRTTASSHHSRSHSYSAVKPRTTRTGAGRSGVRGRMPLSPLVPSSSSTQSGGRLFFGREYDEEYGDAQDDDEGVSEDEHASVQRGLVGTEEEDEEGGEEQASGAFQSVAAADAPSQELTPTPHRQTARSSGPASASTPSTTTRSSRLFGSHTHPEPPFPVDAVSRTRSDIRDTSASAPSSASRPSSTVSSKLASKKSSKRSSGVYTFGIKSPRENTNATQLDQPKQTEEQQQPEVNERESFPPFSPSELRPYASSPYTSSDHPPRPRTNGKQKKDSAAFPPLTPSELQSPPHDLYRPNPSPVHQRAIASAASTPAKPTSSLSQPPSAARSTASAPADSGSGFSPSHAHWTPNREYDEVYEVEASDDGRSVHGSPVQQERFPTRPETPPHLPTSNTRPSLPSVLMSPATRAASDRLVPAVSWLLILNRKLLMSSAISSEQSRQLKKEILSGNPALLSAVDRFTRKENQDVIIDALLSCLTQLPATQEHARAAARQHQQHQYDDEERYGDETSHHEEERTQEGDDDDEEDEDENSDAHGKSDDADDMVEEDRDRDNNPLIVVNTLLPLSLPQLESFHALLNELGMQQWTIDTFSSHIKPLMREGAEAGEGQDPTLLFRPLVDEVSLESWTAGLELLRLHSPNPPLLQQILTDFFRVVDRWDRNVLVRPEMIAALVCFCGGSSHKEKLAFIYRMLSHVDEQRLTQQGLTLLVPPLFMEVVSGFIHAFSALLHLLLLHADARMQGRAATSSASSSSSSSSSTPIIAALKQQLDGYQSHVCRLSFGIGQILHRQYGWGPSIFNAPLGMDRTQFMQWKWNPPAILDVLLQQDHQA